MFGQEAKMIRKAIKEELGLNSRQVSCRQRNCNLSRSVSVVVKAPVALSKVEEIANRWKSVRRCEFSGDILGGGNCFINVSFEKGVLDQLFCEGAILTMEPGESFSQDGVTLQKGDGTEFHLFHDEDPTFAKVIDSRDRNPGKVWALARLENLAKN